MRRSRPSLTAAKVSRSIVLLAQRPELAALLPSGAAEHTERLLREAGLLKPWHVSLFSKRWFQWALDSLERHISPGVTLHLGLRKRFLDDETRSAIADGARQVLVIGAGYDTLCMRLAVEHPQVTFVEVDHPATHRVKREAAEAIGAARSNLHLLGVDLASESESLEDALSLIPSWRRDALSVVVAEGVLMYLDRSDVATFVRALRKLTAAGSHLLLSYMVGDEGGRIDIPGGRLAHASVALVGESWRWIAREGELETFMEELSCRVEPPAERYDFAARYLEPAGLGDLPVAGPERVTVVRLEP